MAKTVLVGISSGIAAFKAVDLIKLIQAEGLKVSVITTESTQKMLSSLDLSKTLTIPVESELFELDFEYQKVLEHRQVRHIELADQAATMVIVPATANSIAKLAHGIADNLLTTTALAVTAPIIICPSMNVNMWHNPAVQANMALLRQRGYIIIEPTYGLLACGYEGQGRLAQVDDIFAEVMNQLRRTQSLSGQKIIVTAGGTQEKIDDVRFVTNRGSGKMGAALADACHLRGAEVVLLRANSAVTPRYLFEQETFSTTDELLRLVEKHSPTAQTFFHTAAISDFTVATPHVGKIKSDSPTTVQLQPQIKIVNLIKKINPQIKLIAFKAEFNLPEAELISAAQKKLITANADAVIANDISQSDRGFDADQNEVIMITKNSPPYKISLTSKTKLAEKILDQLAPILLAADELK